MTHGALRLHQVMVQLMIDPIREGLPHHVCSEFPGDLVRDGRFTKDLPGLDFADGLIHSFPALKHGGLAVTAAIHCRRMMPKEYGMPSPSMQVPCCLSGAVLPG
jgi:hypothetical protein